MKIFKNIKIFFLPICDVLNKVLLDRFHALLYPSHILSYVCLYINSNHLDNFQRKYSLELFIMHHYVIFNHIVCSYRLIIFHKSNYGHKNLYNDFNLRQLQTVIFILNSLNIPWLAMSRHKKEIIIVSTHLLHNLWYMYGDCIK